MKLQGPLSHSVNTAPVVSTHQLLAQQHAQTLVLSGKHLTIGMAQLVRIVTEVFTCLNLQYQHRHCVKFVRRVNFLT